VQLRFAEEGEGRGDAGRDKALEVGGEPGLGADGVGFCEEVGVGLGADEEGEGGDGVDAGGLGGEDGVGGGCHFVGGLERCGLWGSGWVWEKKIWKLGRGRGWREEMLNGCYGRLGMDGCMCVYIRGEGILEDCHFWECKIGWKWAKRARWRKLARRAK